MTGEGLPRQRLAKDGGGDRRLSKVVRPGLYTESRSRASVLSQAIILGLG